MINIINEKIIIIIFDKIRLNIYEYTNPCFFKKRQSEIFQNIEQKS